QIRDRKVALRSGLFANAYFRSVGEAPALSVITSPLHSGFPDRPRNSMRAAQICDWLAREDLTWGQLYLLLPIYRYAETDECLIANLMPGILERLWRGSAYHLRLAIMHTIYCCRRMHEEIRRNLIRAVEALPRTENWVISSAIIDALKALGGLEEAEAE